MKNFRHTKRLVLAMSRCALAYGEAQWTNGYRAAYEAWARGLTVRGAKVEAEQKRLHEKEMKQWERVADVDAEFERIAREVLERAQRGPNYKAAQRLRSKIRRLRPPQEKR